MSNVKPINSPKNPIAHGTRIGHVHLKSGDLSLVKQFYVDLLGFEVINDLGTALFLSAGGYHHHLAFNTWQSKNGETPHITMTGLYHLAILYPTRKDLADALNRLQEAKYPLIGGSNHGTHEALYVEDLEGNGIELAWDRPEELWPLDKDGHLLPVMQRLNLKNLLAELN